MSSADVPTDNSYVTKNEAIPVQKDEALVEDGIDEATADSDAQLGMCSAAQRTMAEGFALTNLCSPG